MKILLYLIVLRALLSLLKADECSINEDTTCTTSDSSCSEDVSCASMFCLADDYTLDLATETSVCDPILDRTACFSCGTTVVECLDREIKNRELVIKSDSCFPANASNSTLFTVKIKNKFYPEMGPSVFAVRSWTNDLTFLDLSRNKIAWIHSATFAALPSLRVLILDFNELKQVDLSASYLTGLNTLSLEGNNLASITAASFLNMVNLKILSVRFNLIQLVEAQAFLATPNLRRLDLTLNQLTEFEKFCAATAPSLVFLSLAMNQIWTLRKQSFVNFSSLKVLTLKTNYIARIEAGAFSGSFPQLGRLNLDNNLLEQLPDNAFNSLNSLKRLTVAHNPMNKLSVNALNGLVGLVNLSLAYNYMSRFEASSFSTLNKTVSLDLSGLMIDSLNGVFQGLTSLQTLKLSNNSLKKVENKTFVYLSALVSLDLHSNRIQTIELNAFDGLDSLNELLLNENRLANLSEFTFNGTNSLQRVSLKSNRIIKLHARSFQGLNSSLLFLDLSVNQLQFVKAHHFLHTAQLRELLLSDNQISSIHQGSFANLAQLTTLDLSKNALFFIEPRLFVDTVQLQRLLLSSNVINKLARETFVYLSSLVELDLSTNCLTEIPAGAFDFLPQLEKLDLSNNRLNAIDMSSFQNTTGLAFLNLNNVQSSRRMQVTLIANNLPILLGLRTLFLNNSPSELLDQFNFDNTTKLDVSFSDVTRLNFKLMRSVNLRSMNTYEHQLDYYLAEFGQSLREIVLSDNELSSQFQAKFMRNSMNITRLELSNVNITNLNGSWTLAGLRFLEVLDLSRNRIELIADLYFDMMSALRRLNLSRNRLTTLTEYTLEGLYALTHLDLSHNSIRSIDELALSSFRNIETLDLSYNEVSKLSYEDFDDNYLENLKMLAVNNNPSLSAANIYIYSKKFDSINLSNGNLTHFPYCLQLQIQYCEHLDLRNNRLETIEDYFFKVLNSIYSLMLSNNLIDMIEHSAFSSLKILLVLDLSVNRLRVLNITAFDGLFNLVWLDLSYNMIEFIDAELFQSLGRLETLNLSANRISAIEDFSFVRLNSLKVLYLNENSIRELFLNTTLVGLDRIKAIYVDARVVINMTVCRTLVSNLRLRFSKNVLQTNYFDSIGIVIVAAATAAGYATSPIAQRAYTDDMCAHITFLIGRSLQLNLADEDMTNAYLDLCKRWFKKRALLLFDKFYG